MRFRVLLMLLAISTMLGLGQVWAQTTTTGELSGTVTDPTGAVVPNATVTLQNASTGATSSSATSGTGYYKFSFLPPGSYRISVAATGFQTVEKPTVVNLGASATTNFQLALASGSTTVEVSTEGAAVQTEDANVSSNFNAQALANLPNPGNDLSAVALTAPGVVMNTGGGAMFGGGNFSVNGLPATSNLFTLDGSNDNDPYFNVNNSGATNLTLGLNDVQESTIVSNGYSGSYGGLAGANVNFVSKSGTNGFHGNAVYWWNGDNLNANNYFFNQTGTARPFVNANQFAGSVGGPIKKDKAFFFFDVEGLYLAIPSPQQINVPTPAFQAAVLNNLNSNGLSASVPFYNTMFGLYNLVPQAGGTQLGAGQDPVSGLANGGGCSDISPSTMPAFAAFASAPCAVQVSAGLQAHTHDLLYVGRYDQNIGNNDKLFVRVEHEHGLQASYTDPISPAFNAVSDQPQWQSQLSETHSFGATKVNDFKASLLWYSAGFAMQNPKAAVSALPISSNSSVMMLLGDGSLATLNGLGAIFPQGRNITQYQFVDDFSWVRGRHDFKVGVNFRRDNVSDHNFTFVTPLAVPFTLGDFASGGADGANLIQQNFPSTTGVPIALYQLGLYAADDLKVTNNLKLTLSFRADHLSNPVCQINCFQRFAPGAFGQSGQPVNTAILSGQHQAFPSVTSWVAQPKIGFAWSPGGSQTRVIRGGVGIFADSIPTGAIDSILQSAPLDPGFNTFGGFLSPDQGGNIAGGCNTGACTLYQQSVASNTSFQQNYAGGGAVTPFNFTNPTSVKVPVYYKWNLEFQQALGSHDTISVMYVGNHGSHEELSNSALNAYSPTTFANLPTVVPDSRFGQITQIQNVANSNYNGLTASLTHRMSGGFQFQASYTWAHALDEISNNSLSPFGLNTGGFYADVVYPQDAKNIAKYNYGNADYDVRNTFLMNYVWSDAFRHLTSWGPNALVKGWTFSGTIMAHTGLPFTVYSNNLTNQLQGTNYGSQSNTAYIFSDITGPTSFNCGSSAAKVGNPCLLTSNFADPTTNFAPTRRNQFYGPNYFDTDFSVEKGFGIPKWESAQFSIGARFFNLFNHPNFYFPVMNSDNLSNFGSIQKNVGSPTSIFGSGLGADNSGRIIQLQAKITF